MPRLYCLCPTGKAPDDRRDHKRLATLIFEIAAIPLCSDAVSERAKHWRKDTCESWEGRSVSRSFSGSHSIKGVVCLCPLDSIRTQYEFM